MTAFMNETATGWQMSNFSTPIPIAANTLYVASYDVPDGVYASTRRFFSQSGVTTPQLSAPDGNSVAGNGVFYYGPANVMPSNSFEGSNYWLDVDFDPNSTLRPGSPTVIGISPPVSVSAGASARFTVTASGNNLQYQWQRNGENIPGATSSSYTVPAAAIADNNARFTVIVFNSAGFVVSNRTVLRVSSLDSSTVLTSSSTLVRPGNSVTLRAQVRLIGSPVVPNGSVTFLRNGATIASAELNETGVAVANWVASPAGVFTFTARYNGSPIQAGSTSPGIEISLFPDLPQGERPPSAAEASRFLSQATFGPTKADVDHLMTIGYTAWFNEQFAAPNRSYYERRNGITAITDNHNPHITAFYTQAVRDPDQLRQRMAWALSQIFVVSGANTQIGLSPYSSLMTFADVLKRNSFGNYRQLLDDVTRSWIMSLMLTYLGNSENLEENRLPDQNYAREILQLFSIGLNQLNRNGTLKLVNGAPQPTYSMADIVGLSKVFTGFFEFRFPNGVSEPVVRFAYFDRRSKTEKRFLGTTLPASGWNNPEEELRLTLDAISRHPNVAPFISRLLIQRFVTSNPSPDYVDRVAAVFENNGNQVRGDFKAVLKAILLDPEARDRNNLRQPTWGKVREPVLRAVNYMRLLNTVAEDGYVYDSSRNCYRLFDIMADIEQRPYHAPTVFNFYRPGYAPPASQLDAARLVAPEMQITDTVSVVEWSRYIMDTLAVGGTGGGTACVGRNRFDFTPWTALAPNTPALVERINLLLFGGDLNSEAIGQISRAVDGVTASSPAEVARQKVRVALSLAFLHPRFIVQR